MICGDITLEDVRIIFKDTDKGTVRYTSIDVVGGGFEELEVPTNKFYKALAIAVHIDGMPEYQKDYPDAEKVMPRHPGLRWIP